MAPIFPFAVARPGVAAAAVIAGLVVAAAPGAAQQVPDEGNVVLRGAQDGEGAPAAVDGVAQGIARAQLPSLSQVPPLPRMEQPPALPQVGRVRPPAVADRDRALSDTGQQLQEPGTDPFAPAGLRRGAFVYYPEVELDGIFSDNIDQVAHGKRAAAGLRIAPSLRMKSLWPRHELSLSLKGAYIAWNRAGEDEASLEAGADLRLDMRRGTRLELSAGYDLGEEDATPARLEHQPRLSARIVHDGGRLRLSATAEVSRTFYTAPLSGGSSGFDDDYTMPGAALRATLDTGGALRPYVEVGGDARIHDRNRDASGTKRNSLGGYAQAGVEFAPSAIWSGALGLRLALRDHDDPGRGTVHGLGLEGNLTWRPRRTTQVVMKASFDIDEEAGTNGARKYRLELTPQHALRRNLTLKGIFTAEYSDYLGAADHEWLLDAGAEVTWTFHRGLALVGRYMLERQWSTFAGGDYLENRISIGLRYRL